MGTVNELVTWLTAQLDEDERVAKLAHPGPWEWSDRGWEGRLTADAPDYHRIVTVDEATKDAGYFDFMFMSIHGPDRVLREVEAKRRIISEYERYAAERRRAMNGWETSREVSPILTALALPYADRPGYREEWRP